MLDRPPLSAATRQIVSDIHHSDKLSENLSFVHYESLTFDPESLGFCPHHLRTRVILPSSIYLVF